MTRRVPLEALHADRVRPLVAGEEGMDLGQLDDPAAASPLTIGNVGREHPDVWADVLKFSAVGAHHGIGDVLHQRPALRVGVLSFRHRRHDTIPREGRPLTCDERRRRTVQKNNRDALRHLVFGAIPFMRDQDIGELLHQPRFGVRPQRSFGNGDIDHRHGGLSPWLRLYCFDWRADGTSMREVLWTSGADRQWQYRHL